MHTLHTRGERVYLFIISKITTFGVSSVLVRCPHERRLYGKARVQSWRNWALSAVSPRHVIMDDDIYFNEEIIPILVLLVW